jgi:transposase
LTYRATVDVPARFRKSKALGAVFGLTCAKYQSGEVDRDLAVLVEPMLIVRRTSVK